MVATPSPSALGLHGVPHRGWWGRVAGLLLLLAVLAPQSARAEGGLLDDPGAPLLASWAVTGVQVALALGGLIWFRHVRPLVETVADLRAKLDDSRRELGELRGLLTAMESGTPRRHELTALETADRAGRDAIRQELTRRIGEVEVVLDSLKASVGGLGVQMSSQETKLDTIMRALGVPS